MLRLFQFNTNSLHNYDRVHNALELTLNSLIIKEKLSDTLIIDKYMYIAEMNAWINSKAFSMHLHICYTIALQQRLLINLN